MYIQNLDLLVSPLTLKPLQVTIIEKEEKDNIITGTLKDVTNNNYYSIFKGIPNLIHPFELQGLDREFNDKYEEDAKLYEEGMNWLFSSFYETEEIVRNKLIAPLNIKPNHLVLNMGCGTGGDSVYIAKQLSKEGKLFNLDLTAGLLNIAQNNLKDIEIPTEFILANGSYLPFANNTFDSVFHFGGINVFSDKKRAVNELVRVTKPNGRVVFGDESAAPWLSNKLYGKIIKNANPLYKHKPPIHLLPSNAQDVSLNYVLGNSFYTIAFTVGEESKLNLDLPIPGKRGGTLRSRYDNRMNKK